MKYSLPLLLLLCLGCETIIEVEPPEYASEPVITSFFSSDSIWSVRMHRSLGSTVKRDVRLEYISDASVTIMEGAKTVDVLRYQGNGRYVSSTGKFPTNRILYTLRVDFPDRAGIQATSSAPPPGVISDYSIKPLTNTPGSSSFFSGTNYQLKIVFSDMAGRNFYRIAVYRLRPRRFQSGPDSVYRTIDIEGLTPGWACGYPESDDAPVDPINLEGNSGKECEEFIVTDRLFDGKNYTWSGNTTRGVRTDGRNELLLVLSSLSKDYYRYRHSLERNYYHNDPLTNEPFPVYSNIEGGLGVFAGYTNTYLFLPIPREN